MFFDIATMTSLLLLELRYSIPGSCQHDDDAMHLAPRGRPIICQSVLDVHNAQKNLLFGLLCMFRKASFTMRFQMLGAEPLESKSVGVGGADLLHKAPASRKTNLHGWGGGGGSGGGSAGQGGGWGRESTQAPTPGPNSASKHPSPAHPGPTYLSHPQMQKIRRPGRAPQRMQRGRAISGQEHRAATRS